MSDSVKDKNYANRIKFMHLRKTPTVIDDIEFALLDTV